MSTFYPLLQAEKQKSKQKATLCFAEMFSTLIFLLIHPETPCQVPEDHPLTIALEALLSVSTFTLTIHGRIIVPIWCHAVLYKWYNDMGGHY